MKFTILSVTLVHLLCTNGAIYSLEIKQTEPKKIEKVTYNTPHSATRIKRDQQSGGDPTPQCFGPAKYSATSCEQYYECERILWWWEAFLKTCPEGEGFHIELQKCNREGLINCLKQYTTTTITPEPTTLTSPTSAKFESAPSTSTTKVKPAVPIDLPHDSVIECSGHAKHAAILCNMYFECELIFELFWLPNLKTCPDGEAFDSKISECSRQAAANCPMQSSGTTVTPQKNDSDVSVRNESVATTKPPALLSTTTLKVKVPDCSGPGRYPAGICNQYYECEETRFMLFLSWWEAKLKTCPDGEAFDKRIGKCKTGVLDCQSQPERSTTVRLQDTTTIGKLETDTNLLELFVSTATDFTATNSEITMQSAEEPDSTTTTSNFEDINAFINILPIITETTQENTLNVSSDNSEEIIPTNSVFSKEQFSGNNLTTLGASSTIISSYSLNDVSINQNITNALETELLSVTFESTSSFHEEETETITTSKYNSSPIAPTEFDINDVPEATNFSSTEPTLTTTNEPVSSELATNKFFSSIETSYGNQDSISESTSSDLNKSNETTKETATLPPFKPTLGALHFLFNPNKNNVTLTSAPVTINIKQNSSEVAVTTSPLTVSSSELVTNSAVDNTSETTMFTITSNATLTSRCSKPERRPGPVCNQYLECVPVSGSYKLETCPYGQAYDSELEECQSAKLLNCSEATSTTISEILEYYDDMIGASPKTTLAITAKFLFIFYFII